MKNGKKKFLLGGQGCIKLLRCSGCLGDIRYDVELATGVGGNEG